jgi:hypothetical protein
MMNTDTREANRRAAWRWGGLIVGLLGLQVTGGISALVLATRDASSVGIVPDYHQKALHWDEEMALQSASQALGWVCEVSQVDGASPVAGLRITITDRNTQPIELASGELMIYRHARATDVRRVRIPPGANGMIELGGCFNADGWWQVAIDVLDHTGNRFVHSRELDVTLSNPSAATVSERVSKHVLRRPTRRWSLVGC